MKNRRTSLAGWSLHDQPYDLRPAVRQFSSDLAPRSRLTDVSVPAVSATPSFDPAASQGQDPQRIARRRSLALLRVGRAQTKCLDDTLMLQDVSVVCAPIDLPKHVVHECLKRDGLASGL
jgi:hypothetical protein